VGLQLVLAFLSQDIRAVPTRPFHRLRRNFKAGTTNREA
jgi:hypothetical protein